MPNWSKPIGIFDSGLGGLTVAGEIFDRLPREDIVYFGDVGRTPYGPRSKKIVLEFSRQDVRFLLEQNVKMIVAACNTASATALEQLRLENDTEILGVIEPGARAAVKMTKNGRVGVIGTTGTINSDSYALAIGRINPDIKVFSMACPLFVPLVEEGYLGRPASRLIAEDYLLPFKTNGIDTLVLGCTHYPLLKETIETVLGENVTLIDSAGETALEVEGYLRRCDLLNQSRSTGSHKFYVSDIPDQFARTARHFLGAEVKNVIRIDITKY